MPEPVEDPQVDEDMNVQDIRRRIESGQTQ